MSEISTPSRTEIASQLHAAFCEVTGQDGTAKVWQESARLRDDLGLDSFAALELLFELEDRLGVRIPRPAATAFQTVGDVISYVAAELATRAVPAGVGGSPVGP